MNRSLAIYQLSFFSFLFFLGVWVVNWKPTPALAAAPTRLSWSGLQAVRSVPQPGRRFTFQAGGQVGLAPRSLKASEQYDYYAALASHYGREPVRTTVIGLRGLAPEGWRHASGDNATAYDDTFVVLRPSVRKAREFLGSTHAGQAVSSLSPKGGVAQVLPGVYQADPIGDFNGMPAWWVNSGWGDGRIPCFRDRDGDGFISSREREKILTATEILVHNGISEQVGTSIGCQVLPPKAMQNFIATVGKGKSFDYVLIDANRPIGR